MTLDQERFGALCAGACLARAGRCPIRCHECCWPLVSHMILRATTGTGKSTFLDTVGLFRSGVITEKIATGRRRRGVAWRIGCKSATAGRGNAR